MPSKLAKLIAIFGFYSLLALQFYIVHGGSPKSSTHRKAAPLKTHGNLKLGHNLKLMDHNARANIKENISEMKNEFKFLQSHQLTDELVL